MIQGVKKDQWDAALYDGKHGFVSKFGEGVIELLDPKAKEYILDLGCGTGDLAKKLNSYGVHIMGIDQSKAMINEARKKYPQLTFEVGDATRLPFDAAFDAIFSNATLHWVKPPEKALQGIYQSLKQGGRFVAEFGGKGNVGSITSSIISEIQSLLPKHHVSFPWYYPSIAEYTSLMEEVGFRVTFALHFDRPTLLEGEAGLRNWIDMFASNLFEGITVDLKQAIVEKVEKKLKPTLYQENRWVADYKRIRVVGVKE